MPESGLTANELRVILFFIGLGVLALIYVFGRPRKPGQGRRTLFRRGGGERVEPTLGDGSDGLAGVELPSMHVEGEQLDLLGGTDAAEAPAPARKPRSGKGAKPLPGVRPDQPIERIVTLFVVARAGAVIAGSDLVVAAEKAGLEFGDRGIFHRLVPGKASAGPVFSMANMLKPGSFDMSAIDDIETSGVTLFMTLPGPLSALDAWDAMLPTAQRLAELLDATVLDESRGTLGRQGIAHVRDDLRAWDRAHGDDQIRPRP